MLCMAVAVGLSSIAIGSILSTALLIGPAATAVRVTRSLRAATVVACVLGVVTTVLGILLAYDSNYWDPSSQGLPVSFFIVSLVFLSYLASGLPVVRSRRRSVRPPGEGEGLMFSGFMVNAWVIGTIVAAVAGVVGFFVVLRGAAFAAHAIPNGAFAGAAGASLIGVDPLLGLGVFSAGAALGIGWLGRRGRRDAVTALALVMMLALGAAFLSQSTEYEPQIFALLFGEILGVSSGELLPVALLGLACIAAVGVLYRRLMLTSLVPEIAEARGIDPFRVELWFLLIVACATTMTVPVVGALLIFTLMIGPPAAARCFTDRPGPALAGAVVIALATIWMAIAASYATDWPVGFFVGTVSAGWYALGRTYAVWRRRVRPRQEPSADATDAVGATTV